MGVGPGTRRGDVMRRRLLLAGVAHPRRRGAVCNERRRANARSAVSCYATEEYAMTVIRRLSATLLVAFAVGSAHATESLEMALADLNATIFRQYMLEHDTGLYAQTAHADYLLLVGIGLVETRDEVLSTAQNLDIESLTVTHEHFVREGDTAVLFGRLDVQGTVMGHPLPAQTRFMSVFARTPDGWKLLARSLTPVDLPPGVPAQH
jgi:hypothetical protein